MKILVVLAYCGFLSFILLYSLAQLYLLILYQFRKERSTTELDPSELPFVTIQLPIFNEKYVIERLIRSVMAFEYPINKFEVQILDDSTDETVDIVANLIEKFQEQGFQILHIQREEAIDFKAGALANGMHTAKGEFIAIFDADFTPSSKFLLETLPWFQNGSVGVVQTRWGHINRKYSLLTQLQAYALNAHFTIEQSGRNTFGHFINFNGTAGIWRSETITESGGWQGDTLTEDLDLSYRAQLKGWEFIYLEDIVSPAELPVEMNALKSQQFRWAKGAAECARKNLAKVLHSPNIAWSTKITSVFHLLNSLSWVSIYCSGLLLVPFIWVMSTDPTFLVYGQFFGIFHIAFIILFFFYLRANWGLGINNGKDLIRFIFHYPAFLTLSMGISFYNTIGVFEGYLGKRSSFVRTPKFHIENESDDINGKEYVAYDFNSTTVIEFLSFLYFLAGTIFSIRIEQYMATPFLAMMTVGFGTVLLFSYRHAKQAWRN